MVSRKYRSPKLASARAYYRLAAKARRASDYTTAEHYTRIAERLISEAQAQKDFMEKLKAREAS